MLGAVIAGPSAGERLAEQRVVWTWEQWRARHPKTEVLSTGYYAPDSDLLFPVFPRSAEPEAVGSCAHSRHYSPAVPVARQA